MRKGAWWTSSAEIICACTWYQRHPTAAGPLVRERERGFYRCLDSNPPRRAVSLINLSSAMRLLTQMCQLLYSEGAVWKRSWQLCFPLMPEARVKRQQGASVRRWGVVSPPRCPHKSPSVAATYMQHTKPWKQEAALLAFVKQNCQ